MANWNELELPNIIYGEFKNFENITLIPLRLDKTIEAHTLINGQKNKLIDILESESVNNLKLKINSKGKYFIPFLQVVSGGKQDRMVTRPYFINSNIEEEIVIPVNCVEQGRWQYSRKSTGEETTEIFKAVKGIRMNASLGALNINAAQGTTWSSISWYQKKQGISNDISPSQSFMELEQAVVDDVSSVSEEDLEKNEIKKLSEELKDIVKSSASSMKNQMGIGLIIDNQLRVIELYGNHEIWEEQLESVVNSILSEIQIYEKDEENENQKSSDENSIKKTINSLEFELDPNENFGTYYTCNIDKLSSLILIEDNKVIEFYLAYSNSKVKDQLIDNFSNVAQEQIQMQEQMVVSEINDIAEEDDEDK